MIDKMAGFIARHPKTILIAATLLLIPAVVGFVTTRINYDILTYIPKDLNSVKGEQIQRKLPTVHRHRSVSDPQRGAQRDLIDIAHITASDSVLYADARQMKIYTFPTV